MPRPLLPLLLLSFLFPCPRVPAQTGFALSGRVNKQLQQRVEFGEVWSQATVGFALYDLASGNYLYGHNANRHFVPASNMKLLTFYLANHVLGHRTPAVFYQEYPDRIDVWGSGYPLLRHPLFDGLDELTPWVYERDRPLVFHLPPEDRVPRYGAGWSYDDYPYGFVYERSALPVFGNRLYVDEGPATPEGMPTVEGSPIAVLNRMRFDPTHEGGPRRQEYGNDFRYGPESFELRRLPVQRALHLTDSLTAELLREALPERDIRPGNRPRPPLRNLNYLEVSVPDTVYRRLLSDSDNFLAEQLLIQSAARRYGTLEEERILEYAVDTLLAPLNLGDLSWRDASGLTRYNLLTPDQLARIFLELEGQVGRERLTDLLAAGGRRGTLLRRFADRPEPYVWAKTGSLSGVHAITGMLRTDRGQWLVFSLLVNNYVGRSRELYDAVDELARYLRVTL